MAKKLTTETVDVVSESIEKTLNFNEDPNLNTEPSKNVKDSWNQITLSLASNGGYTISHGRKLALYVAIQEKVNGKSVHSIKSFIVSKQELQDLQCESREFSAEIEAMLLARDSEESKSVPSKDTTKKKDEIKKPTGKELTGILKKGLESVKKKDPIVTYGSSDDLDEPDDVM